MMGHEPGGCGAFLSLLFLLSLAMCNKINDMAKMKMIVLKKRKEEPTVFCWS